MSQSLHLVVGLGKTGYSIARYLIKRDIPFVMFDTRQTPESLEGFYHEFPNVEVKLEQFPEELYPKLKCIITSPGVSLEEPFIQKAIELNIPVFGDIECVAKEVDVPIICITGTNGKSTVTTLVGEMIKESGLSVAVAGNIGLPVLDMLDIGVKYDAWVLEVSSFQLEVTNSLKPYAATILNITPDHLDRHKKLSIYIDTKQRIYNQAQKVVYNRADKATLPKNKAADCISFGLDTPTKNDWGIIYDNQNKYLARGNEKILNVAELKIKGRHNWLNALAACALAETMDVQKEHMIQVLRRFPGLTHRTQWVRNVNGVDWINDSKGTNVGATVSAITGIGGAIDGKIILIAGGQGKGADFSDLNNAVSEYVRLAILIGEDAGKIEAQISNSADILHAPSLESAVLLAQKHAKANDVVLMSPACASFDMFRDFNHRGDEFIAAVQAL